MIFVLQLRCKGMQGNNTCNISIIPEVIQDTHHHGELLLSNYFHCNHIHQYPNIHTIKQENVRGTHMVYPTLTSHIAVRVTIGHNIIYVCDTISPSYPTLSQKCISMHMNSCLHTHQGMKLHLYAKPMMYAYGCIRTPAFIPNKV